MTVPEQPKIYHIVHIDKLASIINSKNLLCDAEIGKLNITGTVIGMQHIKQRRLSKCLDSYPDLRVGDCVPFYFCPRSVMLYVISKANDPELGYRDGQRSIIHLEVDMKAAVAWAEENRKKWVFTLSNAGSEFFEDRCDYGKLDQINWDAINAQDWRDRITKDGKQAEFLVEQS